MRVLNPVVSTHRQEDYSYDFWDFYFGLSRRQMDNSVYVSEVLVSALAWIFLLLISRTNSRTSLLA